MKLTFVVPFLCFGVIACSSKTEFKTEVDKATGVTVVSSKRFGLNSESNRNNSLYGRNGINESPLGIQIQKIEMPDTSKIYELKISADSQSPRLKIQKENSLVVVLGSEELKFSATSLSANDTETLAEYFPSFRTETATYSNIKEEDLQKIVNTPSPRLRIVGEGRQEEARLTEEAQQAIAELLPLAPVSTSATDLKEAAPKTP